MAHVEHLISEYYDGELSARRRRQVEAHLEDCAACRARLSEMERLSDVLAAYELPDTLTGAETFRARVALRLSRRALEFHHCNDLLGHSFLLPQAFSTFV